MNIFQRIGPLIGGILSFAPNPVIATAGKILAAETAAQPQGVRRMNAIQLIEQTVEVGTVLEGTVQAVEAELNAGQTATAPTVKLVFGGHQYAVTVSFAKVG